MPAFWGSSTRSARYRTRSLIPLPGGGGGDSYGGGSGDDGGDDGDDVSDGDRDGADVGDRDGAEGGGMYGVLIMMLPCSLCR